MARKKIVLTTNAPWLYTGLAENGKFLAKHLYKTGKYDLTYYCQQVSAMDPNLSRQPWKSHGAIPNDPAVHQRMQQNEGYARAVAYGAHRIDEIVRAEKPDILWCSDDAWSFQGEFIKAPWWNQINSILHITIDSLPVLEFGYEQARSTPNFYTWADFAAKEMRKKGPEYSHVKQIYGATDVGNFSPLSLTERRDLRRRFGISEKTTIIGYTGRNQLRKEYLNIVLAFKEFKKEHPNADVKLHFHTSFSEMQAGWDIPRISRYFGVDPKDILATYICKSCGQWIVAPYQGEDQNCPICRAEKSMITPTIAHGVPGEEMKYVYGIRDATVSPLTSGGLEYENVNTLLCGLPLATTNYSSGQDFCLQPFVTPINWHPRFEAGSSFMKASNDVKSIKNFIEKVHRMTAKEKEEIGEKGRAWAAQTFSAETIGKQWEDVFDALPPKDWSSINLSYKPKNPAYPMPDIADPAQWIKALYNNILLVEPDPKGWDDWLKTLQNGVPRQQVYNTFVSIAAQDNAKNSPPQDFGVMFDSNGRKRILFVMKESGGDLFIGTALFKGLKDLYPDADLYVGCDPKFAEVLAGNPHVYRVLPYHPAMEQELAMMRYVDYYYFPALATQRQLAYLTRDKIGLYLEPPEAPSNTELFGIWESYIDRTKTDYGVPVITRNGQKMKSK